MGSGEILKIKINEEITVNIRQDEYPDNPINLMDFLGTINTIHRRYEIGHTHAFHSGKELKKYVEKELDCIFLPIYMYDHSGITIKTSPFSCSWDSGQIGYIYVEKQKIRSEWDVKKISSKVKKQILKGLNDEIILYDNYITGNVYGYEILKYKKCDHCNHVAKDIIDSCYGFYGSDFTKNGLIDEIYLDKELKEIFIKSLNNSPFI